MAPLNNNRLFKAKLATFGLVGEPEVNMSIPLDLTIQVQRV